MKINIGDIFWVKEEVISHPHVVIETGINDDSNIILLCAVTTNMKKINMQGNILLYIGEGNLQKLSIVEVYKTIKINKVQLGKFIGKLSQKRLSDIHKGIQFIEKSFFQNRSI